MAMQWTEDLSSGVEEIDSQHKELINRINQLLVAMTEQRGAEEVCRLLGFLEQYVAKHFGAEETYMTRLGYPGYWEHRARHTEFVQGFGALKKSIQEQGATTVLLLQVQRQVCDWLVNHICKMDKVMAAYLLSKLAA